VTVVSTKRTGSPIEARIGVNDKGAMVVWWQEEADQTDTSDRCDARYWAFVAYAPPSGSWEAPHQLVDHICSRPDPSGVIANSGEVSVVYSAGHDMRLVRRGPGEGWPRPQVVVPYDSIRPKLMATADGETVVVAWEGFAKRHFGYEARRWAGGQWGPIAAWHREALDFEWDAAMDGAGDVTFAGATLDPGIHVKRWPSGQPLDKTRTVLAPRSTPNTGLDVVSGEGGETLVGYSTLSYRRASIRTLYRPRGGPWGEELVADRSRGGCCPKHLDESFTFAVRPSGAVDAVWGFQHSDNGVPDIRYSTLAPH
jgi:hypothetical protein